MAAQEGRLARTHTSTYYVYDKIILIIMYNFVFWERRPVKKRQERKEWESERVSSRGARRGHVRNSSLPQCEQVGENVDEICNQH